MPGSRLHVNALRVALLAAALIAVALLRTAPASAAGACRLGGGAIKHVIIMQFDNVHLQRDNPNVPSDIEQIPALDNFMKDNGSLLSNDHTILISHTSDGILSTETGLYPNNFGGGVGNSFPLHRPRSEDHARLEQRGAGHQLTLAVHLLDRPDQHRRSAVHPHSRVG